MAVTSTNIPSIFSGLSAIGTSIVNVMGRLADASSMARNAEARGQQIAVLNAKSDEELAAMNLRRDDIALYVFRDLLYV